MNIVCEVCGDIGYKHLLLRCRECNSYAVHQYCLEKVIYDASLIEWFCYECVQRRGEVTCTRSLEKVSSESPLSHAHFGSPVRQITKRVKLSRNAGPWRNRKNESSVTKYVSLNKRFSSIKKHTKKKSITKPMGNCTNKEGQIDKVTTHTSAEASCSCESIGTESAKGNHGRNKQVDQENHVAFNTEQPCPLVMNSLGTLPNTEQSHLLETTEGLAYKLKKVPQSFTAPLKGLEKRETVVLGSSCFTSDLGNCALGESGDKLNGPNDSGANLSSKHTDHVNQHTSVGCKNMEGKSVKDKKPVDAHKNMFWPVDSLRNSQDKYEAHGDSNRDIENGFTPERDKEEVRLQPDHCASNELLKINMAINLPQLPTLQNDAVETVMPYSPNGGYEELFSCPGKKNVRSVRERSVDPINISSISQHDTIKASETSGRSTECQKASSCHRGETVKMAKASSSSDKSGEHVRSGNVSLEYVLGYRSYLSKAQKKRVRELIQEIQPEFTIFISVMRKSNVQPPGPYLGITKDYAIAHFPDETTNVTLEMPGNSKKWHPKFYKRDESRKTMLMGQWLDFIRDNHVQEGDICLILPTKDERRCTFMVYVIHETKTNSRDGAGFQRVGPCPGVSSVTMASEIHIEEESTAGEHVPFESDMQEILHEPLESIDSDDAFDPPYFVPCQSTLSKSQKRIVEERVRAIRSEVPICVAVMKNNNVGVAQRWMLELGSRYGSMYLPTKGQTILLQCRGKTWEAKMMFHNGRRWFLNGGWPNFARGNGLRVGDICLFELKKRESKLTMAVHIIPKEKF